MKRIAQLFGLDLAGARIAALYPAVFHGMLAALFDAAPYAVLIFAAGLVFADAVEPRHAAYVFALLVACFFGAWFFKGRALLSSFSTTYAMVAQMRLAAADRLGRMSMGQIQRGRAATLADLFTDRFTLYQDIVTHMWWQVSSTLAFPLLLWGLLVWADWLTAVVIALFAPLALIAVPWSFRLLDHATDRVIPARNDVANRFVELVDGIKDIRLMDVAGERPDAARRAIADLERKSLATELAPSPAILAFGAVWSLAMIAAILVNVWALEAGRTAPVTLAVSLILAARLCASLADLGVFLVEFRFARRALASIRDFIEQPLMSVAQVPAEPAGAALEIDGVSFAHADEPTLEDVSLAVQAGQVVALVGHSGSGKSTLAGLVARLWDVDQGAIRIGGADIRQMSPDVLNATVSMVLQDVSLFEMSVADNIRLGRPQAAMAEVERAARAARIHERIMDLPQGYDTPLGEGGAALSGGERQRLAIARALLKDAPVLVLDEASSSVDLENEWLIQEAMDALTRGRTVIVIAHRLWTVAKADRIALMRAGRIVESGTHEELLAANGDYKRLWDAQQTTPGWLGRSA